MHVEVEVQPGSTTLTIIILLLIVYIIHIPVVIRIHSVTYKTSNFQYFHKLNMVNCIKIHTGEVIVW